MPIVPSTKHITLVLVLVFAFIIGASLYHTSSVYREDSVISYTQFAASSTDNLDATTTDDMASTTSATSTSTTTLKAHTK